MRRLISFSVAPLALSVLAPIGARSLLDDANTPNEPVLAALHAYAEPPTPAHAPRRRVVIAVLDGLGEKTLRARVEAGVLGAPSWSARVDVGTPSLSRPGYHVLLTGVPQEVSGVRTNGHVGPARADAFTDRVRASGGRVAWVLQGVNWLADLAARPGDSIVRGAAAYDAARFRALWDEGAALVFVHLLDTDVAGHEHGARDAEYGAAADRELDTIARLRRVTDDGDDDVVWFVGADHGHTARGGHGGPEPEVVDVTWYGFFSRPTPPVAEPAARVPATRLAATFAAALGVEAPRETLGAPLPLPGQDLASPPGLAARVAAVRAALRPSRAGLVALSLGASAFTAYVVVRGRVRSLVRAATPSVGALAAYATLGRGMTLSAIDELRPFVARTFLTLAMGAAAACLVTRDVPPERDVVLVAFGLFVASAVAVEGSLARAGSPYAFFAPLLLGITPAAALVGCAAARAIRAVVARAAARPRSGRQGTPGC